MNIYELAFGSYIYSILEAFDKSYTDFKEFTDSNVNLKLKSHRMALLKWLNFWGCRNFYKEYHNLASEELLQWHKKYNRCLPKKNLNLWELNKNDLDKIDKCYEVLVDKTASTPKGGPIKKFGHTPSSKILSVLRPNSLIAWDRYMRKEYKITSYKQFLIRCLEEIKELEISCHKNKLKLEDVPSELNKPSFPLLKLIDEYHWVTVIKNCKIPDTKTLKKWLKWSK